MCVLTVYVCVRVCVCVCVRACVCACVCVCALRTVSMDKIFYFTKTLIIINLGVKQLLADILQMLCHGKHPVLRLVELILLLSDQLLLPLHLV